MAAPKKNEFAKLDYDPVFQWGPEGVDEYLVERGGVKDNVDPSPYGVGDQPDPMRHLNDPYVPKHGA